MYDSIKFDRQKSAHSIAFLAIVVCSDKNKQLKILNTKPTNKQNYLYYWVCHHKHLKDNLPYSNAIRLGRICTDNNELKTKTKHRDVPIR